MAAILVPSKYKSALVGKVVLFVPPLLMGSVPESVVSERQLPPMEKQPFKRSTPLPKVEEAVVERMLRRSVVRPRPKVEVAVPATFRSPLMVVEPVLEIEKSVEVAKAEVEEPMANTVFVL